jgi:hypothetical protein
MTRRLLTPAGLGTCALLAAGVAFSQPMLPPPAGSATTSGLPAPTATRVAAAATPATQATPAAGTTPVAPGAAAPDVAQVRARFAHAVYDAFEREINHDRPQAMLRAIVVMKIHLSDEGHWIAEVLRENDLEPALTKKALASVEALATPADLPEELRDELRHVGFVESWLFQTDGHFALKTLALPQRAL